MSSTRKKITISVEGNIGSGKSTVLARLAELPFCDIVAEPVESWTNIKGNNILAMLYENPQRWGFAFQSNAQLTLAKLHAQPAKAPVKVMERSIYSARYCFVENLYRSKIIQPVEYEILNDWFELMTSNGSCNLDLIVYLRALPEMCLQRIQARNRHEEAPITIDYLKQLHECHEEWLGSKSVTSQIPILIIDANQTKDRVYQDTNTHLVKLASC